MILINKIYRYTELYATYILFVCWFSVQAYLFYVNGINISGESINRIVEAKRLMNGNGLRGYSSYMYFSETFLIFISLKLKLGYAFAVVIQLLINLYALNCFYKYLYFLYGNLILALAGGCLLLLCVYYQLFNTYLYTESLFFSFSIIYSFFLLRIKELTIKNIVIIFLFLVLLCITRPSGIFFLAATLVYLFFFISNKINIYLKIASFILFFVASLFFLNLLMGAGSGIDIILPFKNEMVICEVPTLSYNVNIDTVKNGNSLYGLFYYITHNTEQFYRLALLKSEAFFGLVRPYYSKPHNFFLITYFYSLYLLILATLLKFNKKLPVAFIYLLAIIVVYWFSVVFSCDEWHNRFFLTLTPFLITAALYFFKKKSKLSQ